MRVAPAILLPVALGAVLSFAQDAHPHDAQPSSAGAGSGYVHVHKFDPNRDAVADIRAAVVEARRTGKRIILDIGGDWCQYCHQMDQFFHEHDDVLQIRDKDFITVEVYYGRDNKNQEALARYSKILGVPHFFVLESDGTLLYSQHVRDLRSGAGTYDTQKMKEFLLKWAPPALERTATER